MTDKTLGEMTPAERDATVKRAAARFQDELDRTAPAIGKLLEGAEIEQAPDFMAVIASGWFRVRHRSQKSTTGRFCQVRPIVLTKATSN